MASLQGKVAIVTGGARGIGYGICKALAAAGCCVIIADISADHLGASAKLMGQLGLRCETLQADVADENSVKNMVERVRNKYGHIDVLVCSAGIAPNAVPTLAVSTSEWNRVLGVNLLGVFLCCREVAAIMATQGHGKIINVASLNAVSPAALTAAYNVSKAGVVSLTQTLAIELAPFQVCVNAISPGPIETEFHDVVMPQRAATLGISREEMVKRVQNAIPLGRWGKPDDVAKAVLFLASDESDWITGQNLIVAGGLSGVQAVPSKDVILGRLR